MQLPDSQRGVDVGTCAFSFTGVMANPAADPGERVFLFKEL
jgi:hypothetical protein